MTNNPARYFTELGPACIDFLFPPECCYCGLAIPAESNSDRPALQSSSLPQLCKPCIQKLPTPADNPCLKCGATQGPYIPSEQGCVHCKGKKFAFASAVSLSVYENDLRKMSLFCKQNSGQRLTWYLTQCLWQCEQSQLESWQCDFVVHVPMHWVNRLTRHVHPAESIASCLAQQLKIPHLYKTLKQSRRVSKQSSLAPTKRRKNVQDLFHASRIHKLKDKTVLLVDDILTTGTTANECAKALKKAGAKQVYVAVLSRGTGQ
ncbi:MAG: ComF family protein [Planctomycetaceae bacterium]|nr:ComF family protein [Planctomycetaceae bacterium]